MTTTITAGNFPFLSGTRGRRRGEAKIFSFKYAGGSIDVEPLFEIESDRRVRYMPGEGIASRVLDALRAKFGDLALAGAFDTNGTVIIRFNALKEEVK